jgi:preprotein translocase subunit SecG
MIKRNKLIFSIWSEIFIIIGSGAIGAILSRTTINSWIGIFFAIIIIILGILIKFEKIKI